VCSSDLGLVSFLKSKYSAVLAAIKEKGDLPDELKAQLLTGIEEFSKTFY
jgi:hypothetical protein